MRKLLSLFLVCVMMLGILPVMSFAADPETITIEPYDIGNLNGWENWADDGGKNHLLLVVTGKKTAYMDKEFKLTFTNGGTSKTVVLKPTSGFDGWEDKALYRFQTAYAEGDNKFVPEVGVDYSITVEVLENGQAIAKSAPTAGFICNEANKPNVDVQPDPKPTPDGKLVIENYGDPANGGAWENWGDSNQTELLIVAHSNKFIGDEYDWKITINNGESDLTITLKSTSNFDFGALGGDFGPAKYPDGVVLYRFEPCIAEGANKFIPAAGTDYSISVQVLKNGTVIAESESTSGFGTGVDFAPIADGEPTPFPKPDVDPEPEPEPKPTPSEKPEPKPTPSEKPEPKPSEDKKPEPKPSEDKKPSTTPEAEESGSNTGLIVTGIVILAVVAIGVIVLVVVKKKK